MSTATHTHDIVSFEFFLGGRALFTVSNGSEHRTFKITSKELEDGRTLYFAALLTGPDNESSYTYMGMFNPKQAKVFPTRKSTFSADSQPMKIINWSLQMIRGEKELPAGYSIRHEGKCCRCGRTLTDPVSIELGIGPTCRSA